MVAAVADVLTQLPRVVVRDANLTPVGELDTFRRLTWTDRLHAVGGWVLETDSAGADLLLSHPGGGLIVYDGQPVDGNTARVLFSGPVGAGVDDLPTAIRQSGSANGALVDLVTVIGTCDNGWLADRVAHPEPGTASPPFASSDYDVRTGDATTVILDYIDHNAGPHAVAARQVAGLTLGADAGEGATITGRARWQNLLEFLGELATAGGVVFGVRQSGRQLVASCTAAVDRSASIRFAVELGNLDDSTYEVAASTATAVYCGGQGELAARDVVLAVQSGRRRIERFVDRRDISDSGELADAAAVALVEGVGKTSLSMTPIDTPTCSYGVHYSLGDQVTVQVDKVGVVDVVTAVETTIDAGALTRKITVGTESSTGPLARLIAQRRLARRLNQLERI